MPQDCLVGYRHAIGLGVLSLANRPRFIATWRLHQTSRLSDWAKSGIDAALFSSGSRIWNQWLALTGQQCFCRARELQSLKLSQAIVRMSEAEALVMATSVHAPVDDAAVGGVGDFEAEIL